MTILNYDRNYTQQPLFFGEDLGIFDSIHINQEIKDIMDRALAQNWTVEEFSFVPCQSEFLEEDDGRDLMIETLMWQWSADSMVTNLYTLVQPFITDDLLTQLMLFNTYMETVHSFTYSEIVKNAFPDPEATLNSIKDRTEVLDRLSRVEAAFSSLRKAGLDYSTKVCTTEDIFDTVYKGMVALYLMERLQFIASFAITFALGEMGRFQPVAMAVRKICADEVIIHADTDVAILSDLKRNSLYNKSDEFQTEIAELVQEVVNRELQWADHLFEGRSLPGITVDLVKDWVLFNAGLVQKELGIPVTSKVKVNPLPFMKGWITMNSLQAAPQEQSDMGQYLLGAIEDDTGDLDVDLDF